MAKTKKTAKTKDSYPKVPTAPKPAPKPVQSHAVRETIESLVIAFVLAFLFRTFEAEAFVIPTGSMAPTLMGRHKDVECPKCNYRYQVSASEEESDNPHRPPAATIAGMCPMCNYVMPMLPNLPQDNPITRATTDRQPSYNGDRILVNKYIYAFADPERWDVVVFKYPGDANMNYIKRLVGLPGETLRIYQGDLFVSDEQPASDADFEITRKPPEKVLAMRQLVHDTNYDPAELDAAGWPLRWQSDGWQVEKSVDDGNVQQLYHVDPQGDDVAWLRYRHLVPPFDAWQLVERMMSPDNTSDAALAAELEQYERPKLITDANPYNAREDSLRGRMESTLEITPARRGVHWVGDLILEAHVDVKQPEGELLLDLVEGGQHFTCTINLQTGEATLAAEGAADFAPKAKTPIDGSGSYRIAFANVDDQLLLWVNGDLMSFKGGTSYDVNKVFGERRNIVPRSSEESPGDLAPAGVGSRRAQLAVTRLQVWRDIYYIADRWSSNRPRTDQISDYSVPSDIVDVLYDPSRWDVFATRRAERFPLGEDQYFVMGDNSAESSDARLWYGEAARGGRPGGDYLERRLLIGKALCVYWPHSWHRVPGTPIPFPLFPNFSDMRLVR